MIEWVIYVSNTNLIGFDEVVAASKRAIGSLARRYACPAYPAPELAAEATAALWMALEDLRLGRKVSEDVGAYVYKSMRARLISVRRKTPLITRAPKGVAVVLSDDAVIVARDRRASGSIEEEIDALQPTTEERKFLNNRLRGMSVTASGARGARDDLMRKWRVAHRN